MLPSLLPRSPKGLKSSFVPTPEDPHHFGSEVSGQQFELNSEERAVQLLLGRWVWCTGGFCKIVLIWPFCAEKCFLTLQVLLVFGKVTSESCVQVMEVFYSSALMHNNLGSFKSLGVKIMSERLTTIFDKTKLFNSCNCCVLKYYMKEVHKTNTMFLWRGNTL